MRLRNSLVVIGGLGATLLGCGGKASGSDPGPSGGTATGGASTGAVPTDTGAATTGGSTGTGAPSDSVVTGGSPTTGGTTATGGTTRGSGGRAAGGSSGSESGGTVTRGAAGSGAAAGSSGGQAGASGAAGQEGADETAGAAGFAGSVAVADCQTDEDCSLNNDCCTCEASPIGAERPACDVKCTDPRCADYGPDAAAVCYRGFCVLDVTCERWQLTCSEAEPTCAPGMLPVVIDGCWGPCIDARECPSVPSCDYCAEGDVCLKNQLLGTTTHCIEVPSVCAARPDCACLGEAVCLSICTDTGPRELTCVCPGC
ncbi:MAG: hypothetical protein JW940_26905 [Polyangiaceae bacterium]|nr:hypothetical protein [Polyangiaceae bacterium]